MRSGFFTQLVANTLIGLMGLNSLTWVPQAWADAPDSTHAVSRPSYTLSLGIPNRGDIDAYHNAYTSRDRISNALYLLRNTAVEDLLNTRRSLKVLLGGTAHLRQLTNNSSIGFAVPGGITDLYLVGNIGATARVARSDQDGATSTTSAPATSHGIDTASLPAIADPIHWLRQNEPEYDENLRGRLLLGLAFVSAQLVKYDQQLKYLTHDFWADPAINKQFDAEYYAPIRKYLTDLAHANDMPHPIGLSEALETAKRQWFEKHQMSEPYSVLLAHREYLMDRYHLLGIEIDGKPLYQRIYAEMEKQGFPSVKMVQPVIQKQLPTGTDPIPMPDIFEKTLDAALSGIAESWAALRFLSKISTDANKLIDNALLQSLAANTQRLEALSSQIDYDDSRSSPLLALAPYEDLWDSAISKYAYLEGVVDLQGAKEEMQEYWKRRDKTNKRLRYATFVLAIGIGVAAMVMTGGTAAAAAANGGRAAIALLGIPVRSWLIGSGMVAEVGLSYNIYAESRNKEQVASGFYLGSKETGSHAEMLDAIEMKESDYRLLIFSFVGLGASTLHVLRLAAVRNVITRAGQTFVKITQKEMAALRSGLGKLATRAEVLAPLGRAMLAIARGTLGITVSQSRAMTLGDAIVSVARKMKLAPAVVAARLEAAPYIGRLVKGWKVRQLSSKIIIDEELVKLAAGLVDSVPTTFAHRMATNQIRNAVISVVAEKIARGDKMLNEEKGEFIGDMIRGTLITAVLTFNGQALRRGAEEATYGGSKLRVETTGFWATGTGKFARAASSNAAWGMIINGTAGTIQESILFAGDDSRNAASLSERFWKVAKGTAWSGLTLGLSSTFRYNLFQKWVEPYIARHVKNKPMSKILIQSAWVGNDLFGSWSYVSAGQWVGALDSAGKTIDESTPEDTWEPTTLKVDGLVPAYFKTDTDAVGAEYLFDFLRNGEFAGPAPVIQ